VVGAQISPMGFVSDKVALGQVSLRVLRYFPVSIIPPLLHIHYVSPGGWKIGPLAAAVPQRHSLTPSQQLIWKMKTFKS
jgi:hypothetical protein